MLCRLQKHKCESLQQAQEENQTFPFFLSSYYDTKLFDITNESRKKRLWNINRAFKYAPCHTQEDMSGV